MHRISSFVPPVNTANVSRLAQVNPRFKGELAVSAPSTIGASRYENQRVALSTHDMVSDLIEKLDEIMTVTGEVYSGNEAFTGTLSMKLHNQNFPKANSGAQNINASLRSQVENTMKAVMVISSEAVTQRGFNPLAEARATFTAVDPQSVIAGQFKTVPVTPLTAEPHYAQINQDAGNWNMSMFKFYKDLTTRLGVRDPNKTLEDLSKTSPTDTRLVNSNVYVTTRMLNKKATGHGGITTALALKDMASLADGYIKNKPPGVPAVNLTEFSAHFAAPYVGTDALQFDTTIDDVDSQGNMFLSTRINKYDTKQRKVTGPIIMVHAKMEPIASYSPKADPLDASQMTAEDRQRQTEAFNWAKLQK